MAFGGFLKQSTVVDLMIGPFLDDTDFKTAETALTISQADVRLSKNGANIIPKNEAASCTHDELGNYKCPLDATDTNTCGLLVLMVHESGALPIKMDYQVVEEAVFNSLYAADASGFVGPGDYTVTLTIRTTGGAALAGVEVWLNTSDDRSDAVAGVTTTNDSGQVEFTLDYAVKYYVFCHKTSYTFSSASMTPAAGSVTFTKDIGTASTTGGSNYEDSFLTRGIASTRQSIDEPAVNAKYTDSDIIAQMENAYAMILGDINRNTTTPVVARTTITISSATAYVLPSVVGPIYAIYALDTASGLKIFYDSFGRFNPLGQSLWLEGNILHLQAAGHISAGTVLTIEYIPSGTARLHNGVCTLNADGTEVTLSATPNAGSLDTHDNAYAGCVLRILTVTGDGATGNYLQERTISSYDCTTRVATISVALDPIPSAGAGGYIIYEIAPTIHKGLDTVIALYAAYAIVGVENGKKANSILLTYRTQMRNLRLNAYYSFLQGSMKLRNDSYDNRRYRHLGR